MSSSLPPPPDLPNLSEPGNTALPPDLPPGMIEELMASQAIENEDGTTSLVPPEEEEMGDDPRTATPHDVNIVEMLDQNALAHISTEVLEGIEADFRSNETYHATLLEALDAMSLEKKRRDLPFKNAAGMHHPILSYSVVRFNSNAMAEMLPPGGPVRMKVEGDAPGIDTVANRKQQYMNYYLTEIEDGYYPDYDQGLFLLGIYGSIFRKVYRDPYTKKPISRFRTPFNLIVSFNATTMIDARVTEVDFVQVADVRRYQVTGYWRDIDLSQPQTSEQDSSVQAKQKMEKRTISDRPEDAPYCIYTCHCMLNVAPIDHLNEDGTPSGLPLPFIVTIDRDSQQILRIERNWDPEDPLLKQQEHFSHYKYLPGLGFYGIGLGQLLAASEDAATTMLRQALDSFTLSSFPGGYRVKTIRPERSDLPIAPCEFREIDTGGLPINQAIMALPYKDVPTSFGPLYSEVTGMAEKLGSVAELNVGEGNQNAPVGSTLALLDMAVRVESAVLRRLHTAHRKELGMIAKILGQDPEATYPYFVEGKQDQVLGQDFNNNEDIVPVSDPNVPTQIARITKAQTILTAAMQSNGMLDVRVASGDFLRTIGVSESDIKRYMPEPAKGEPSDPITEFQKALKKMPLAIGPQQSHQAHIISHIGQMQIPNLPPETMQALLAHTTDHLAALYRAEAGAAMGGGVPEGAQLPPQMEQMLSERLAQVSDAIIEKIKPILEMSTDPMEAAKIAQKDRELQFKMAESQRKGMETARQDAGELIRTKAELRSQEQERELERSLSRDDIVKEQIKAAASMAAANARPQPKKDASR